MYKRLSMMLALDSLLVYPNGAHLWMFLNMKNDSLYRIAYTWIPFFNIMHKQR